MDILYDIIGFAIIVIIVFAIIFGIRLYVTVKLKDLNNLILSSNFDTAIQLALRYKNRWLFRHYKKQNFILITLCSAYMSTGDRANFYLAVNEITHIKYAVLRFYLQTLENLMYKDLPAARLAYSNFAQVPQKQLPKRYKPYEFFDKLLLTLFDYQEGNYATAKISLTELYPQIEYPITKKFVANAISVIDGGKDEFASVAYTPVFLGVQAQVQQQTCQNQFSQPNNNNYSFAQANVKPYKSVGALIGAIVLTFFSLMWFLPFVVFYNNTFGFTRVIPENLTRYNASVHSVEVVQSIPRINLNEYDFAIRAHVSQEARKQILELQEGQIVQFYLLNYQRELEGIYVFSPVSLNVDGEVIICLQESFERQRENDRIRIAMISTLSGILFIGAVLCLLRFIGVLKRKNTHYIETTPPNIIYQNGVPYIQMLLNSNQTAPPTTLPQNTEQQQQEEENE